MGRNWTAIFAALALGSTAAISATPVAARAPAVPGQPSAAAVRQQLVTGYAADAYAAAGVGGEALAKALRAQRAAQANATRLSRDLTRTQAQRDTARRDADAAEMKVAELVAQIEGMGAVEASLRAQIDSFARAALGMTAEADPRKLDLLAQFAAGLEEEAYPLIREINLARVAANAARMRAIETAAAAENAGLLRENAALAGQMRLTGKASVGTVIAEWEIAQQADPAYTWGWIELSRLYLLGNRTTDALRAAQRAQEVANPRDLAAALDSVGETQSYAGNLAAALAAYEESLIIRRRLADENPGSVDAQHGIGISLDAIGDVRLRANNRSGALRAYEEGLAISRRLANESPENAGLQLSLSISLDKTGDLLLLAGNRPEALTAFEESLAIRRRLTDRNPGNVELQFDVSISFGKIGYGWWLSGDIPAALKAYEACLTILRELVEGDPGNARYRRDLSKTLDELGDVNLRVGDERAALALFEEALEIDRRLTKEDAANIEARYNLGISLAKIGQMRRRAGNGPAALAAFEESLIIRRQLVDQAPSFGSNEANLWSALGWVCVMTGNTACDEFSTMTNDRSSRRLLTAADRDWAARVLANARHD